MRVCLHRQKSAEEVDLLQRRLSEAAVEAALLRLRLQQQEAEYDALRAELQKNLADDAARQADQVSRTHWQLICLYSCPVVQGHASKSNHPVELSSS